MTTKKSNKKASKKSTKSVSKKKNTTQTVDAVKVKPNVSLSRLLMMFSQADVLNALLEEVENALDYDQDVLVGEKALLKEVSSPQNLKSWIDCGFSEKEAKSRVADEIKDNKNFVAALEKLNSQKKELVSALKTAKKLAQKSATTEVY